METSRQQRRETNIGKIVFLSAIGAFAGAVGAAVFFTWIYPIRGSAEYEVESEAAHSEGAGGSGDDASNSARRWAAGLDRQNLEEVKRLSISQMLARLNAAIVHNPITDSVRGEAEMIMRHLIERDPAAALDWCIENRFAFAFSLIDILFENLASQDLALSVESLHRIERQQFKIQGVRGVAMGISQEDPRKALQFLDAHSKGHIFETPLRFARDEIVSAWAREFPKATAEYVLQTRRSPTRDEMIDVLAATWATSGAKEALEWSSESVEVPLDRRKLAKAVLAHLAERGSFDEAFQLAAETVSASDMNQFAEQFAGKFAQKDPEAALSWAGSIDHPLVRQRALGQVAHAMVKEHPAKAHELVATLSNPDTRARIHAWHIQNIAPDDPELAVNTAQALRPIDGRDYSTKMALAEWLRQDPSAAKEFVLSANADRRPTMAQALAGSIHLSDLGEFIGQFPSQEQAALVDHVLQTRSLSPKEKKRVSEIRSQ